MNRLEAACSFFQDPFQTAGNLARQFRRVELLRMHAQQFLPAVPQIVAGCLIDFDRVAFKVGHKDGVACMLIKHAVHGLRKYPSLIVAHSWLQ